MPLVALLFQILLAYPANAQVPLHKKGTICFTSSFWCWANPPGLPGQTCSCPTPYGPLRGTIDGPPPGKDPDRKDLKSNEDTPKSKSFTVKVADEGNLSCKFDESKVKSFTMKQIGCGSSVYVGSVSCTDENGLSFNSLAACSLKTGDTPDATKCFNLHKKQNDGIGRQETRKSQEGVQ